MNIKLKIWRQKNAASKGHFEKYQLDNVPAEASFLEMGELIARDALMRNESCGGHFREEYQTTDGEAQRDDEHYAFVAAYEFQGVDNEPILHKEELKFENVELKQRNYK